MLSQLCLGDTLGHLHPTNAAKRCGEKGKGSGAVLAAWPYEILGQGPRAKLRSQARCQPEASLRLDEDWRTTQNTSDDAA